MTQGAQSFCRDYNNFPVALQDDCHKYFLFWNDLAKWFPHLKWSIYHILTVRNRGTHQPKPVKNCKIVFGTYCEVHDEPNRSNSMVARMHKAIVLGPGRNLQGTHIFFCINTGSVLKRRNFIDYPMDGRVINKVDNWGERKIWEMYRNCLEFRNCTKEKIMWDYKNDLDRMLEDEPSRQLTYLQSYQECNWKLIIQQWYQRLSRRW